MSRFLPKLQQSRYSTQNSMLKILKVSFTTLWFVAFATPVFAQDSPARISDILIVLRNIISILAPVAVIAFFVMAVYGGFKFVRSRGEPKNVEEARNILQYAIIGAVLVTASWLILVFISYYTNVDVTTVRFPTN